MINNKNFENVKTGNIVKIGRMKGNIKPGDKLLVLGDEERGLAIVHQRDLINFVGKLGAATKE